MGYRHAAAFSLLSRVFGAGFCNRNCKKHIEDAGERVEVDAVSNYDNTAHVSWKRCFRSRMASQTQTYRGCLAFSSNVAT